MAQSVWGTVPGLNLSGGNFLVARERSTAIVDRKLEDIMTGMLARWGLGLEPLPAQLRGKPQDVLRNRQSLVFVAVQQRLPRSRQYRTEFPPEVVAILDART